MVQECFTGRRQLNTGERCDSSIERPLPVRDPGFAGWRWLGVWTFARRDGQTA